MTKYLKIKFDKEEALAIMLEKEAPKTCNAIWNLLPISGELHYAKFAGKEVFFIIPLVMDFEKATPVTTLEPGSVAYWPNRQFICIYYGKLQKEEENVVVFAKIIKKLDKISKKLDEIRFRQGKKIYITGVVGE